MANFKDTEIEAAVSRYVRDTVKTERTDLGPLDTGYTFDEVREFVASTLIFDPSAIFYLLSLAANRVNQDVTQALEYLEDIITGIDEVGRDTVVVSQTSLLADAAAALLEVQRTIEDRNAISARPFSRYTQALDRFTDRSLTPNIRRLGAGTGPGDAYEIVRPPQQAQSAIKADLVELRDLHPTVVSEARQLTEALSEFLNANLPLVAIQKSVMKVRTDLRSLKTAFDGSTRDGAIEKTRDAFLAIQAGKAVITNLTTISDPRESRMASTATSTDRASAYSPSSTATPAQISTQVSAPYLITPTTNQIKLEVDGGTEQVITLADPDRAFVLGSVGETYDIHGVSTAEMTSSLSEPYTVPASPDNVFEIYADGIGYTATLTSGSRTAAQVAAEINAANRIDGSPGTFDDVGTASDSSSSLKLEHDTEGSHSITLGDAPVLNASLGFTNKQTAVGEDANNELRLLVEDVVVVTAALTNGAARTAAQVASDIGASPYLEAEAALLTTATGDITVVKIYSTAYGEASHVKIESLTPTQQEAAKTLGFSEGQESRGAYFKLSELISALEAAGLEMETSFSTPYQGNDGEAVNIAGDYKLRLASGTLSSDVTSNDMLFISNGANAGWYPISSVSLGGSYDELTVARPFSATTGAEAQNQAWQIHRDLLFILSEDSTISSKLKINMASANTPLGLTEDTYIGSVSGVRVLLSGKPLNFTREDVVAGDKLTLRGPTYTTEHTITAVTYDGYQIEVTPEVPNDMSAHLYKIESAGALAYAEFISNLEDWFTSQLEPSKFDEDIQELERVLNPLLVNKNPSAALVGSARNTANNLLRLYTRVFPTDPLPLDEILSDFTTPVAPRIDALLDMLQERGMDRAHELLLLGAFDAFFGVSKDSSSYGGNLLEKMRAIAQNDVPLGRSIKRGNVEQRLTGSYEEADADYDFSDQDREDGATEVDDIPDLDPEEDILNKGL